MKVLIVAYACEPGRGSEPGIGWGVVEAAAQDHEVWLLTRPDEGRAAVEAALAADPRLDVHVISGSVPLWQRGWQSPHFGMPQLHHYLWQMSAYLVARRLMSRDGHRFDLVHHATFAKCSSPSFVALLPSRHLWGPVAGGEHAPLRFLVGGDLRSWFYEAARLFGRSLATIGPFVRISLRRSDLVLTTSEDTARWLSRRGRAASVEPAIALPDHEVAALGALDWPDDGPFRFVSIGRLERWKGFHLGIAAFARCGATSSELVIVGDGPERERLEELAERLGVGERVRFVGALPRASVLKTLGECHTLVHPSLHDSGGWVCLEAMAAGRPVVCLDLGGPGLLVPSDAGIRIPAKRPSQAIKDLSDAMDRLTSTPGLAEEFGRIGRQHVSANHCMSAKRRRQLDHYELAIQA